jgi:hypothetical protein
MAPRPVERDGVGRSGRNQSRTDPRRRLRRLRGQQQFAGDGKLGIGAQDRECRMVASRENQSDTLNTNDVTGQASVGLNQ